MNLRVLQYEIVIRSPAEEAEHMPERLVLWENYNFMMGTKLKDNYIQIKISLQGATRSSLLTNSKTSSKRSFPFLENPPFPSPILLSVITGLGMSRLQYKLIFT